MELASQSLDLIIEQEVIAEDQARIWIKQLTLALNHMHTTHRICHGDIKTRNVLVVLNDAKFKGFRYAKILKNNTHLKASQRYGTIKYYAPEMTMAHENYDPMKSDVWAMGILLYKMLNCDFPFKWPYKGIRDNEGMKLFVDSQLAGPKHRTEVLLKLSKDVQDFNKKCFDPNPDTRLNTQQMLDHPWLRDCQLPD